MIRYYMCIMIVAVLLLFSGFSTASAQENGDNLYLIFELMKVDNEQEAAYAARDPRHEVGVFDSAGRDGPLK